MDTLTVVEGTTEIHAPGAEPTATPETGTPVETAQAGSTSSAPDVQALLAQIQGLPDDAKAQVLKGMPDQLTKTVRKSLLESQVQEEAKRVAAELAQAEIANRDAEVTALRGQLSQLTNELRQIKLSTMSNAEQKEFLESEKLQLKDAEVNYYRSVVDRYEQDQAKQRIYQHAREKWSFDDDDIAELDSVAKAINPNEPNGMAKFVDAALSMAGKKMEKINTDVLGRVKLLEEKLKASDRVESGQSAFAATAPAAAGGELSFEELEERFRLDPERYLGQYSEARSKRGL